MALLTLALFAMTDQPEKIHQQTGKLSRPNQIWRLGGKGDQLCFAMSPLDPITPH